ncbi:MAG: hypothetical protein PUP93_30785, partial [Rhizonema sp. NSF051]|nr:hypothetical protein [Rhizonema sp. NSF051]
MADFIRAIKHPQISFKGLRPDLTNGKAVLDKHGIPCSAYGGFGCVIKYETFVPKHKLWGIKCYNVLPPGLEEHYGKVTKYLNNCPAKRYFLEVSFSTDGIRVKDKVYPILKMEWSEGVDLYQYLQVNISDSKKLRLLADEWHKVCNVLMSYGIVHGDIQHGNIHVLEKGGAINIKLIDYDSLFFSASGDICKDTIKGLDGYQHPKRKNVVNRCIQPDYFSYLVVYISILALAEDGNLWKELDLDNKEHLLFSLKDFENPFQSEIFKTLTCGFSNKVKTLTKALIEFCDVEDVSKLSSVQKLLLQYPALSREIKKSPNGLYSVKDTNQKNSHSPSISISISNRIKKRPGEI